MEAYNVLKRESRREIVSAMTSKQIEMVSELEKEGSTMAFRTVKERPSENRDIIGVE